MRNGLISEALYAAADHVAAFGLYKGDAFDKASDAPLDCRPMCTVAAVTNAEWNCRVPVGFALRAVKEYLNNGHEVWWWSDAPATTAAEVIETLRAAALIEAAKERADELAAHGVTAAPVEAVR